MFQWTDAAGKQRRATVPTLDAARTGKADREREVREGVPAPAPSGPAALTLARFARELYGSDLDRAEGAEPMLGRYSGRRGQIRESTRHQYRRMIELYWLPALGRRSLESLTARDLRAVLDKFAVLEGDEYRADGTLRRAFAPMAALMATGAEEGLIVTNIARDVRVPSGRDELRRFAAGEDTDEPEPARAMTREQLATFLGIVDPRWRVFFDLLAATGLRYSEAAGLRWGDLTLDGSAPHLKVKRACVRGVFGPPKSKYARRSVPLPHSLVVALRQRHRDTEWPGARDVVFTSSTGTTMGDENLRKRTLLPAAEEAGVPWIGFHTFRHTTASLLIAEGRSIVQVSRWLGHHSPAFTLHVYAHLLDEGVGGPLEIALDVGRGVTEGSLLAVRDSAEQSEDA